MTAVAQDESRATYAPRLRREDGIVDWGSITAVDLDRRVRALQPWPGVTAPLSGQPVRLIAGAPTDSTDPRAVPGEVVAMSGEAVEVATASGVYRLSRVQPAGGRPMSAAAYLRGRRTQPFATMTRTATSNPVLARNRQATHEYSILETFEAGIELTGTEVKALRDGRTQLREGYVRIENGEAWLLGVNIAEYAQGNRRNHEPQRRRRLLLHKREIEYLGSKVAQQGLTLIPLRIYLKANRIKLEFGLGKGKKLWDKRQAIAERDARRDAERVTARAQRL